MEPIFKVLVFLFFLFNSCFSFSRRREAEPEGYKPLGGLTEKETYLDEYAIEITHNQCKGVIPHYLEVPNFGTGDMTSNVTDLLNICHETKVKLQYQAEHLISNNMAICDLMFTTLNSLVCNKNLSELQINEEKGKLINSELKGFISTNICSKFAQLSNNTSLHTLELIKNVDGCRFICEGKRRRHCEFILWTIKATEILDKIFHSETQPLKKLDYMVKNTYEANMKDRPPTNGHSESANIEQPLHNEQHSPIVTTKKPLADNTHHENDVTSNLQNSQTSGNLQNSQPSGNLQNSQTSGMHQFSEGTTKLEPQQKLDDVPTSLDDPDIQPTLDRSKDNDITPLNPAEKLNSNKDKAESSVGTSQTKLKDTSEIPKNQKEDTPKKSTLKNELPSPVAPSETAPNKNLQAENNIPIINNVTTEFSQPQQDPNDLINSDPDEMIGLDDSENKDMNKDLDPINNNQIPDTSNNNRPNDFTPTMKNPFQETEESHFFAYFLTIIALCICGYVVFHNKQKIIAIIIEGKNERHRRSSGAAYRKLDTNLADALEKGNNSNIIY